MKPPSGVKPTRMFSCFFLMNMLPAVRLKKTRSEEHTSELQSQSNLVCRLLLEKKNTNSIGLMYSCTPTPSLASPVAPSPCFPVILPSRYRYVSRSLQLPCSPSFLAFVLCRLLL